MGSGTQSKKPWEIPSQEYYYHGTTRRNVLAIAESSLNPSARGRSGPGVYLAYTEDQALDWAEELNGGSDVLRVKGSKLKTKGFTAQSDEEATVQKPIAAKDLEIRVKTIKGGYKWIPLADWIRMQR